MASRLASLARHITHASARPQNLALRATPLHLPPTATMSSAAAGPSYEWLVVVPDKPGSHEKRLEVRPKHFEGLEVHKQSGKIKTGGAILNEKPEVEDPKQFSFYGSTVTVVAHTRQEVIDLLNQDIYTASGVWDVEKAQIWPAKIAFRNP